MAWGLERRPVWPDFGFKLPAGFFLGLPHGLAQVEPQSSPPGFGQKFADERLHAADRAHVHGIDPADFLHVGTDVHHPGRSRNQIVVVPGGLVIEFHSQSQNEIGLFDEGVSGLASPPGL